jgi:spermidine synthase
MTLQEIWNELSAKGYKSDKGDVHSYLPIYEEILSPYRTAAKNILEIGLFNGDSLRMFEQYFSGKVYGIDCDEQPHAGLADLRPIISEGKYNIFIMDATNSYHASQHFSNIKFDVIIEDAGHDINQQLLLYATWKPYLSEGAIYIIEDVQDIDRDINRLKMIDPQKRVEILDGRYIKGRYDDVLVVIK